MVDGGEGHGERRSKDEKGGFLARKPEAYRIVETDSVIFDPEDVTSCESVSEGKGLIFQREATSPNSFVRPSVSSDGCMYVCKFVCMYVR